jgi:uncharacterized protein YjiS (DUF1127 family)
LTPKMNRRFLFASTRGRAFRFALRPGCRDPRAAVHWQQFRRTRRALRALITNTLLGSDFSMLRSYTDSAARLFSLSRRSTLGSELDLR